MYRNKNFLLFLAASAFLGVSQSIDAATLNNFLNDTFQLSISQRTLLEFPRELPGFLVVFITGLLFTLGDIRIAALANIFAAIGMFGLGYFAKDFTTMLICLTIFSLGQHLFLPLQNSIGMSLTDGKNFGYILGKLNAINTAAYLLTSIGTSAIFKMIDINYKITYTIAGISLLITAILIMQMDVVKRKPHKSVFIKKEYTLFYLLSMVYGARKQIFITFGPWVLIKTFGVGVSTFAFLGFIIASTGIFFKPAVGKMIDKYGERFVLTSEAVILIIICLCYALTKNVYLICACYIFDQLSTSVGIARATYLKKIAVDKDDVSPTLSMGISLDHAVSMVLPFLGGLIWNSLGYQYVFVFGAAVASLNLFLSSKITLDIDVAS